MIRCIAAIDNKLGLAGDHGIPWDLPTDRQFFVDQTAEGIILMGYGTYREFKQPMHGRVNYVATQRTEELMPGFEPVGDVPAFFAAHKGELINNIGGAGLFTSTLQLADELILTRIHADFHCTKFFPDFEPTFGRIAQAEPITENGVTFCYETWRRKTPV